MAKQVDRTTLGYLGTDFQFKLVKCFIEDHKFFTSVQEIVDQNMFTDENLRRIVGFMKDRYAFAETVANYSELEIIVRSKVMDAISVEVLLATLKKIADYDLVGMDIVQSSAEKFFKQQNLTKAINRAQEIIKKGDISEYYNIEDLIKKALDTNTQADFGYHIFDNYEEALDEDFRCAIPTGAENIDEMLYGGLGKGELGVIIAPSGVGKTSATSGFAAYAATYKCEQNNYKGYKVFHIHFEDNDKNIKRKYYGYMTNIDAQILSEPTIRPKVLEIIGDKTSETRKMLNDNIICYHPQSGEMSATELKNKIRHLIARGFKPDLVIVDYFECLKLERSQDIRDDEYTREGITMRKLESIAHEFDVALWCPVQGTKSSIGMEYVGLQQAGGSVKKVQIGHVILTFARTNEQRIQGTMNIYLEKFRGGRITEKSIVQHIRFNNGTCRFERPENENLDDLNLPPNPADIQTEVAKQVRNIQRQQRS